MIGQATGADVIDSVMTIDAPQGPVTIGVQEVATEFLTIVNTSVQPSREAD